MWAKERMCPSNVRKKGIMSVDCDCFIDHVRAKAPWTCPCSCHNGPFLSKPKPIFTEDQEERIKDMINDAL
jgi:hypothetical protein